MKTKIIKIDFYQPETQDDGAPLKDLLLAIERTKLAARNVRLKDGAFRIQRLHFWDEHRECTEGDLVRIRLDEPAAIASLDGEIEAVALDESRGICETTAFLYDASRNMLLLQRTKIGVSSGRFAAYLSSKSANGETFHLTPVVRPEVIAKLNSFDRIRKFRVKVARPADLSELKNAAPSVARGLEIAREFEAPVMDLVLQAEGRESSLSVESVIEHARNLLGYSDANKDAVRALSVSGKDEDDDTSSVEVLDLLDCRFYKSASVTGVHSPDSYYEARRDALREAWLDSRAELRSYKVPGNGK